MCFGGGAAFSGSLAGHQDLALSAALRVMLMRLLLLYGRSTRNTNKANKPLRTRPAQSMGRLVTPGRASSPQADWC